MKQHVVDTYENYKEENRLTTNNARRIEFETTVRVMDEWIGEKKKILDCAAGTGVYAFYFADKGHEVTATDITPRHVEIMDKNLQEKSYKMQTAVLDAVDMRMFDDETFDVVCNKGPFYHLIDSSKEYKKLLELICGNKERLKATMTDEQKELFEKYSDCVREYQTITDFLIFQNSFKLGARMMLEDMEE